MAESALPNVSSSERDLFWKPRRIVTAALASIAAVAGLIANVGSLTDFLQPSLSGPWLLTLGIQHSSLKSYEGMSATFQLFLVQDAHSITGKGEKIKVNAKDIPASQHQQISLRGTVSGDVATLSFVQTAGRDGAARQTDGELTLKVRRAGILGRQASLLEGSFSGTAASTTGSAVAIPQPQ
jgi:hypothetical protein